MKVLAAITLLTITLAQVKIDPYFETERTTYIYIVYCFKLGNRMFITVVNREL